jgi:hypothetical protein
LLKSFFDCQMVASFASYFLANCDSIGCCIRLKISLQIDYTDSQRLHIHLQILGMRGIMCTIFYVVKLRKSWML